MQLEGMQDMGQIERLRAILEQKQRRFVGREEACEVGELLVSFFKTLADQDDIDDDQNE